MMRARLLAATSLCGLLVACGGGGGGVSSTPPPPDTSLTSLQSNNTFANIAVTGNASFPKSGAAPTNNIANAPVTVSYDAKSKGYTISTAGRSQTFLPADINASLSNSRISTYVKTSGSTTDSLTLTKPGTSGHNYQYVGGGYWQRTVDGASTVSGSLDAFAYGFETSASAVPRTGRAEYAIDLLGAETTATNVLGIAGSGLTQVDFASGAIVTHGSFAGAINGTVTFSSEAKLSSSSNAFNGNFRFDDGGLFTGSLNGAFFGPQAEEVGGAYSVSATDGRIAVGTIIGRGSSVTATNTSLSSPTQNEFFTNDTAQIKATLSSNGTYVGPQEGTAPLLVNYDASRQKYTLIADTRSQFFGTLTQVQGNVTDSLSFVAPSGTQYIRGGEWRNTDVSGGAQIYAINDFTYGVETPDGAVPRSGQAGYAAQISGTMADGDYPNLVSFSGNGSVTVAFTSGQINFDAGVHYVSEAPAGFAQVANGKFTATAQLSSTANLFSSAINGASMDGIGNYSGTLNGRFYGPSASELGAVFHLNDGSGGVATGLIIGQQDANVLATVPPLANLPQLTTFDSSRYLLLGVGAPVISTQSSLAYDPANQKYTLNATGNSLIPAQITFAPSDISSSNAIFDSYNSTTSATGNATGSAKIFKAFDASHPTVHNPLIDLTYTSFADINLSITNGGTQTAQFYYPFGVDTPSVQMPQHGTGTYDGIVYGRGRQFNNLTAQVITSYTLGGTSHLTVDFGAATFTDTLNITDANTSASLATITAAGTIGSNGVISGNFGTGATSDYRGTFFGPHAVEYGSVFTYSQTVAQTTPPSNISTSFNGVIVGKQSSLTP